MTKEIWEKSLAETRTYRGYERHWVEPGDTVVVRGSRTRIFTEAEWHAFILPPWTDSRRPTPHRSTLSISYLDLDVAFGGR